jgi:hypothetical protein
MIKPELLYSVKILLCEEYCDIVLCEEETHFYFPKL